MDAETLSLLKVHDYFQGIPDEVLADVVAAGRVRSFAAGEVAHQPDDPVVKIGAVLLSGAIALSSHSAKAGTRLLANHSPEPFSNIGLSLGEDALVVGGVWAAITHPIITLVLVILLLAIIIWTLPKLIRLFRRQFTRLKEAVRS